MHIVNNIVRVIFFTLVLFCFSSELSLSFELGDMQVLSSKDQGFYAIIPFKNLHLDGYSTVAGSVSGYNRYIDCLDFEVKRKDEIILLVLKSDYALSEPFSLVVSMSYRNNNVSREYLVVPKK